MTRSMTAFARLHRQAQDRTLCWELRSVNHRYLEVSVHLPEELRGLEITVREHVAAVVKRGKVECHLRLQSSPAKTVSDAVSELPVNLGLVQQLLQATQQINDLMGNAAPLNALDVLRWPGVLHAEQTDTDQIGLEALALLDEVLRELVAVRLREGAKILAVIDQRCAAMHAIIAQVRQTLPAILTNLRARLLKRFTELGAELDPARLEQEMLMLIQKIDVDEEMERLAMHINEVCRVVHEDEPVGRRLDFLMQELNREANTLGAKSVDTETTRASIELKVIIEQMREQIQNIE